MSEIMLQQTQVERVIPKFGLWMRRFPTWTSLATAKTSDLLRAWAGLGYNIRALRLRDAARHVVEHGVPEEEIGWRALPGVGPYAAAALTEFAGHRFAVVIDTNVRRVAGRLFLGIPHPMPSHDARIRRALLECVPRRGRHWDVPQAFMDLGSSVCLPTPSCTTCPLRTMCGSAAAFLSGNVRRPRRTMAERRQEGKPHPDRIYRGRILATVRERGPIRLGRLGTLIDPTFDPIRDGGWIERIIGRMAKDGVVAVSNKRIVSIPRT
ncbi:A/G-specific adenine glycosylase [Candidatus Uhrbacteria bacterium]|nr:A/G-specific adenine glycosylase [Candidatus Uhrbacteria bacterium]